MTTTASSPGNLFLCGEHAVVYGYPAVICSVDRRTHVKVEPAEDSSVTIESDAFGRLQAHIDGKDVKVDAPNRELDIFASVVESLGIPSGFKATISSDIPVKSGMSSSTAVLSGLIKALDSAFGLDIALEDYYDILLPIQRRVHGGKASGAEIYSSACGGFHRIEKKGDAMGGVKIDGRDLDIVVADTRVHAPTYLTVKYHIPSLIDRDRKKVFDAFGQIGSITKDVESALCSNDMCRLGGLLDENQGVLSGLGVSHPKLDDCIREARGAGALGAKLSGSGWGGVMFALVEPDTRDAVYDALVRTGAHVMKSRIGVEGARGEDV